MAAPLFNSTLAPANNSVLEIRKGLFDLLKKIQAVSDYLDEQIGGNEGELTPTGSPTFARVITPRIDNNGGDLQVNPTGGRAVFRKSTTGLDSAIIAQAVGTNASALECVGRASDNVSGVYFRSSDESTIYGSVAGSPTATARAGLYNQAGAGIAITSGGFARIGTDASAPAVKMWDTTFTMPAAGGNTLITILPSNSKVLSVQVLVNTTGNEWIPPEFATSIGDNTFRFWFYLDATDQRVRVGTLAGGTAVASKPAKLFLIYKE